jgi:hypothetical protein
MIVRKTWALGLGAILLLSLTGCGGDGDAPLQPVTQAEYRAAVETARQCVAEKGFEVSEIMDATVLGMLAFSHTSSDAANKAYDKCYDRHLARIEHDWFYSNVPTGAEREVMFADFARCLEEEAGVTGVTINDRQTEIVNQMALQTGAYEDEQAEGMHYALLCMDRYRYLWPDGMYPL